MSKDNGHVVVYESEGQRLIDQWFWHGGGWAWVLTFVVVLIASYSLWFWFTDKPGRRRRV